MAAYALNVTANHKIRFLASKKCLMASQNSKKEYSYRKAKGAASQPEVASSQKGNKPTKQWLLNIQ